GGEPSSLSGPGRGTAVSSNSHSFVLVGAAPAGTALGTRRPACAAANGVVLRAAPGPRTASRRTRHRRRPRARSVLEHRVDLLVRGGERGRVGVAERDVLERDGRDRVDLGGADGDRREERATLLAVAEERGHVPALRVERGESLVRRARDRGEDDGVLGNDVLAVGGPEERDPLPRGVLLLGRRADRVRDPVEQGRALARG